MAKQIETRLNVWAGNVKRIFGGVRKMKTQSVQRAETAIQCNRDYVTCTSSEGKMAGSFKPNGGAAPRKSSIRPNRR